MPQAEAVDHRICIRQRAKEQREQRIDNQKYQ